MRISVNGEIKEFNRERLMLNELLEEMQFGKGVAVALNETFVLRTNYAKIDINDGDRLDILSPVQGG